VKEGTNFDQPTELLTVR